MRVLDRCEDGVLTATRPGVPDIDSGRTASSTAHWQPPLDVVGLQRLRDRLRSWVPFDGGALLDDVASALDEVPPSPATIEDIAENLKGHLESLVSIALSSQAADRDTCAAVLVRRARALHADPLPGKHHEALPYLRRLGWITNELYDRLVAFNCVREAA
ncbi:DUF6415 family natural product biosynthesis protein [Streptomyces cavernicola]|uniref:DUF6415 family natural product biosynthesis protein n=1 Tax=Streptomyces cavernicola TaxID=3043613 RepID=A0ABT6SNU5_9ACTN|nr:DUF6415 family natural product biosynthesis protein [Streptomyces sp. B-S-A6]MDI3408911.1 DUF6415 family natural product biosynthesis protein [Streptomyces sp. B-S-A6]